MVSPNASSADMLAEASSPTATLPSAMAWNSETPVKSPYSAPRSKLGVERWVGRHVAIDGLEDVKVHALYRAMDFLVDHAEEIQRRVFFSTASLLNLEVDLLFFDTTTAYFDTEEADQAEDGLRCFGRPSAHTCQS